MSEYEVRAIGHVGSSRGERDRRESAPARELAWPKVGIFAQRASSRPNRLGLTTCEVVGVDGLELALRGLDAIDGSPVLDIKPYITEFEPRGAVVQPGWISELMAGYW